MTVKRKRKVKYGSGVRKAQAARGISRRRGKPLGNLVGEQYVRHQHLSPWPTVHQEDMYFKMNNDKKKVFDKR